MRSAAGRVGIRSNPFVAFDPLLIDGFNRADGSLGTAYFGQAWSTSFGTPAIASGKFTSNIVGQSRADISVPGSTGVLSVAANLDPGPSLLGDQAYSGIVFFKDPSTQECYFFQICQRNWYLVYRNAAGSDTILEGTNSNGYTYSTPERFYVSALALGEHVYYVIERGPVTGGSRTEIVRGSHNIQITNGSYAGLFCLGSQSWDNFTKTTITVPAVSLGSLGVNSGLSYNIGSVDMVVNYRVTSDGASSGPQQWNVTHLRMPNNDFNYGYRYQWADSTQASDYMIVQNAGQSILQSYGSTASIGTYRMSIKGTALRLDKQAGGGIARSFSSTVSNATLDVNTYLGIATTNRTTIVAITAMPLS